ncbi:MAG: hypothetical protein [Caudoviricetes sp.]|nr:MAG: hypothetical protein [Caudoviricetes sp.]
MNKYKFYYIPRTDMDSMTPGRMIAQATHAAQNFSEYMKVISNNPIVFEKSEILINRYNDWKYETNFNYGTTIVLKPNTSYNQVDEFNNMESFFLDKKEELACYKVIDPEYFIKDGLTNHTLRDICTGIYFFGTRDQLETFGNYKLFDMEFEKV